MYPYKVVSVPDQEGQDNERRQEIHRLLGEADSSTGLLVLPTRRLADDIGVYDDGVGELVKDLVRDGIVVSWADEPERRRTSGRKSADQFISAILSFPFGVAGNAAWYAIANWLGLQGARRCNLEFFRQTNADGSTLEHLRYSGPASEVVELMKQVQPPAPPPSQADG
jgi:hypothetical protein